MTGAPPSMHSRRGNLIKKFIKLADTLRDQQNFDGCMAVVAGLQNASIYRLRKAWDKVDSKATAAYEDILTLCSNSRNYARLRDCIHSLNPPCVPYLGMYLTDLTFIEDGNADTIGGLINFSKRLLYASVLQEIKTYQVCRAGLVSF